MSNRNRISERTHEKKWTKRIVYLCSCALFLFYSVQTDAQDTLRTGKVITNAQIIGIGHVNQLDTYLSPLEYRGFELRYLSHSIRENNTRISRRSFTKHTSLQRITEPKTITNWADSTTFSTTFSMSWANGTQAVALW